MKRLAALAFLACAAGCAFVPRQYARLDEALGTLTRAQRDPEVAQFAPAELQRAAESFQRAAAARDALDDSAVVDHLAYVARQRAAISMEMARARAAEERVVLPQVARR